MKVRAAGETPALEGSAGVPGAGGFSPGVWWSITSSRRLFAFPSGLRALTGEAGGEVDTLGCGSPPKGGRRRKERGEPPRVHARLISHGDGLPAPVEVGRASPGGRRTPAGRGGGVQGRLEQRGSPPESSRCRAQR